MGMHAIIYVDLVWQNSWARAISNFVTTKHSTALTSLLYLHRYPSNCTSFKNYCLILTIFMSHRSFQNQYNTLQSWSYNGQEDWELKCWNGNPAGTGKHLLASTRWTDCSWMDGVVGSHCIDVEHDDVDLDILSPIYISISYLWSGLNWIRLVFKESAKLNHCRFGQMCQVHIKHLSHHPLL